MDEAIRLAGSRAEGSLDAVEEECSGLDLRRVLPHASGRCIGAIEGGKPRCMVEVRTGGQHVRHRLGPRVRGWIRCLRRGVLERGLHTATRFCVLRALVQRDGRGNE